MNVLHHAAEALVARHAARVVLSHEKVEKRVSSFEVNSSSAGREGGKISRDVTEAVRDLDEVVSVFLFGSLAEGSAHVRSDIDLAVLFRDSCLPERCLDVSLEIGSRLRKLTGRTVDVIPLDRAHPSIAFRAIRGALLLDRDPVRRSLFSSRTISRYHAYRRFLKPHSAALEERAREGRFGTAR